MKVLVVNAGSSSLNTSVLEGQEVVGAHTIERWDGDTDLTPLNDLLDQTGPVDAVRHRIVHGGPRHAGPARVNVELVRELTALTELAPLHQPRALTALRAVS